MLKTVALKGARNSFGWRWFSKKRTTSDLPKLPVPRLADTLEKYLKMLKVIANDSDFKEAQKLAEAFGARGGEGEKLQFYLETRAQNLDSWLSDWWLKYAYMDFRSPLPVYGSPGLAFPPRTFRTRKQWMEYAAKLVHSILLVQRKISKGDILTDTMPDGTPLEMAQYYHCFGTTRIPGVQSDELKLGSSNQAEMPKHIVVMHNGHVFSLKLYEGTGEVLSWNQISDLLETVVAASEKPAEFSVGLLTTERRDTWAPAYRELSEKEGNRRNLDMIESGLFVLCLDRDLGKSHQSKVVESAKQMLHGGGSKKNSGNRWFDKTLQLCVNEKGSSGLCYEHSPCEGPPIARIMEMTLKNVDHHHHHRHRRDLSNHSTADNNPVSLIPLEWDFSENIKRMIQTANDRIEKLADNYELFVLHFGHYGKAFKKALKISPDSFIQMAIQLAFWKLHMELTPTYETGMTRMFKLGRTETIRLPSPESARFVQSFYDSSCSDSKKIELLMEAIISHQEYLKAVSRPAITAMSGQGIDRHLLGLKISALESGSELPEFFKHSTYADMNHMKLSTSQVPSKHAAAIAFGPLVQDGYGIFYNPQHSDITFSISSLNSCSETSAQRYSNQSNALQFRS